MSLQNSTTVNQIIRIFKLGGCILLVKMLTKIWRQIVGLFSFLIQGPTSQYAHTWLGISAVECVCICVCMCEGSSFVVMVFAGWSTKWRRFLSFPFSFFVACISLLYYYFVVNLFTIYIYFFDIGFIVFAY